MPVHRSAGIILYRMENEEPKFLLLKDGFGNWDFPKGGLDKGESGLDAAKRETQEETGIKNFKIVPGFKETLKYFIKWASPTGKAEPKFVVYFLGKTKSANVKLSWEHKAFTWLDYKSALRMMKFKNGKDLLKKANKFIQK